MAALKPYSAELPALQEHQNLRPSAYQQVAPLGRARIMGSHLHVEGTPDLVTAQKLTRTRFHMCQGPL